MRLAGRGAGAEGVAGAQGAVTVTQFRLPARFALAVQIGLVNLFEAVQIQAQRPGRASGHRDGGQALAQTGGQQRGRAVGPQAVAVARQLRALGVQLVVHGQAVQPGGLLDGDRQRRHGRLGGAQRGGFGQAVAGFRQRGAGAGGQRQRGQAGQQADNHGLHRAAPAKPASPGPGGSIGAPSNNCCGRRVWLSIKPSSAWAVCSAWLAS